jgi:LysM repeat protein
MSYLLPRKLLLFCILMIGVVMSACIQVNPTYTPTATSRSELTPYLTVTPNRVSVFSTPVLRTPTFQATITPTPVTYTVVKGDTMLGIALRFGITLEELMAANPQINPRIISVDTVLVIPLGEGSPVTFSTPTPLPVAVEGPGCFSTAGGGVWCFLLVMNTQLDALENLSAHIFLISPQSKVIAEGFAIPPLNAVSPEQVIPLSIYFPPPLPDTYTPQAELVSALPVIGGEERYLPAKLKIEDEVIEPDGLQATIEGEVSLPKRSLPANQTWIALVAYGTNGEVVGVRKWEAEAILEPSGTPFVITVYSPDLHRASEVLWARPLREPGTD